MLVTKIIKNRKLQKKREDLKKNQMDLANTVKNNQQYYL